MERGSPVDPGFSACNSELQLFVMFDITQERMLLYNRMITTPAPWRILFGFQQRKLAVVCKHATVECKLLQLRARHFLE